MVICSIGYHLHTIGNQCPKYEHSGLKIESFDCNHRAIYEHLQSKIVSEAGVTIIKLI